jgi:hypothetical protein
VAVPDWFDPVAIDRQLIEKGVLQPPGDPAEGPLGADEKYFTEFNSRLYALWRVSMARQIHPDVLVEMSEADLLFLAGQTSKGYPDKGFAGIALEANKVDGNAIRARTELAKRGALASPLEERNAAALLLTAKFTRYLVIATVALAVATVIVALVGD